jgi:hypothetical protein
MRKRRGLGSVLLGLGATLALVIGRATPMGDQLWVRLRDALVQQAYYVPHSWLGTVAWQTLLEVVSGLQVLIPVALVVGSCAVLGGVISRSVASARLREGKADPLDRVRARPRLVRVLTAAPATLVSAIGLVGMASLLSHFDAAYASGYARSFLVDLLATGSLATLVHVVTRAGVRTALAPVEIETTAAPKNAGDIGFSAVAVTARTRGVVGAFAALTVAMVASTLTDPSAPWVLWVLAAYAAAAVAAPFAFQRVSRIAVGLDGVWVRDASQTHFFAHSGIDEARPRGADLELVRRGHAVLRLQMHGEDAGRRDEVLARVNEAIARSRESAGGAGERVVQAMPAGLVVASSQGGGSYRLPSISREQLWDLIEGPAADASTRTAAAEALSAALDDSERSRLRVAAARCAEPNVRVALGALAGEGEDTLDETGEAARERRVAAAGR